MDRPSWPIDRADQFEQLLELAREGQTEPIGTLLQIYRHYLTVLATTQFDRRLRRRMSPSDLVQETMLAAYRDFSQFRGRAEGEFLSWLRQILIRCLHHALETHLQAKRRDVRRDVSIEQVSADVDRSVARISQALAGRTPPPSTAITLADQLAKLRPEYRDVIVLRNLQGLRFDEIAKRTDRTSGAARMLWLRAIEKFKRLYETKD